MSIRTIEGAREKLQDLIDEGRRNVASSLESIKKEFAIRQDIVAKPTLINYEASSDGIKVVISDYTLGLTSHSYSQLCERAQVPRQYIEKLLSLGEYELVETNLRTMVIRICREGLLLRKVGNTVKGILSVRYKRMDATPIFESFVAKAIDKGFMPYQGFNTEYRYQLRFLYPQVFEPAQGEYVVYGLSLTTGDYGGQALEMDLMALRIVCVNLAIGYDVFRKIHLGRRFVVEEDYLELSDRTYRLDAATIASAVSDVVDRSLEYIEMLDNQIKSVIDREVDVSKVLSDFRKKGMSKNVAERVKVLYEQPSAIEILPTQKGVWRLSNAISMVAQSADFSPDKRIDLEKMAMDVLLSR
jgi:hypothetical protein